MNVLQAIVAYVYALLHPETVYLTIVRRYVDAKKNYIGELYLDKHMIGASCDNLPFTFGLTDYAPSPIRCALEFKRDFNAPLGPDTVRVGAFEPSENEHVKRTIALRRYCTIHVTIRNGFIEHVMEQDRV